MIKKIFKWTGTALLGIAILLIAAFTVISYQFRQRSDKTYHFSKHTLTIPSDSATINRGRHLILTKGCNDCHGSQLEGKVMMNDFPMGRLSASNLTSGKGGIDQDYTTADWLTALKHGVGRNGKALLLMPSHETTQLTDKDLAAIIAYCKSLPPADHVLEHNAIGPLGKVLASFDKIPLFAVEKIDHKKAQELSNPEPANQLETGRYLAIFCTGCHRENLKGGAAIIPGSPPVPDISSSGNPGKWTEEQFKTVLRTGKTPSGHQMKSEDMPWKMTANYTDEELSALYEFLRTK